MGMKDEDLLWEEVSTEHIQGLAGKAVHEVYADVGYARFTADADCVKSLGCGVTAMQKTQHLLIKCLHAHAYAVDPDGMQCGYELRRYVIGITLYGEFLKVSKADDRVYG